MEAFSLFVFLVGTLTYIVIHQDRQIHKRCLEINRLKRERDKWKYLCNKFKED